MKKKLFILALITFLLYTFIPGFSGVRAENEISTTTSNELPSNVFLQKEKRSLGADYGQSMLTTKQSISAYSADDSWDDDSGWGAGPGGGWGESNEGSVGGPIGNATLPIIFSILILYLGYRRVTTSRRRNDI